MSRTHHASGKMCTRSFEHLLANQRPATKIRTRYSRSGNSRRSFSIFLLPLMSLVGRAHRAVMSEHRRSGRSLSGLFQAWTRAPAAIEQSRHTAYQCQLILLGQQEHQPYCQNRAKPALEEVAFLNAGALHRNFGEPPLKHRQALLVFVITQPEKTFEQVDCCSQMPARDRRQATAGSLEAR